MSLTGSHSSGYSTEVGYCNWVAASLINEVCERGVVGLPVSVVTTRSSRRQQPPRSLLYLCQFLRLGTYRFRPPRPRNIPVPAPRPGNLSIPVLSTTRSLLARGLLNRNLSVSVLTTRSLSPLILTVRALSRLIPPAQDFVAPVLRDSYTLIEP